MASPLPYALITGCAAWAIYLALVGKSSAAELAAGLVVATTVTAALLFVRRESRHHFQIDLRWISRLRALPLQVLRDCAVVYAAILRRPSRARGSGRFGERDFHAGNEHPAARSRRALVICGISLAPNTYVLGSLGLPEGKLLIHQLVPEKSRGHDPQWPL
jgi:hypothetical protein